MFVALKTSSLFSDSNILSPHFASSLTAGLGAAAFLTAGFLAAGFLTAAFFTAGFSAVTSFLASAIFALGARGLTGFLGSSAASILPLGLGLLITRFLALGTPLFLFQFSSMTEPWNLSHSGYLSIPALPPPSWISRTRFWCSLYLRRLYWVRFSPTFGAPAGTGVLLTVSTGAGFFKSPFAARATGFAGFTGFTASMFPVRIRRAGFLSVSKASATRPAARSTIPG